MSGRIERLAVGDDSTRVHACGAGASRPGVVVLHAWWGLNDDVIAYADRLAGEGFSVLAPDLVRGRTATTIEEAEQLVEGRDEGHADAVTLAAIDRHAATSRGGRVGVVGFSFGAAWALWCAAKRPAVAGSIVYYGTLQGPSLTAAKAPVLGHFAERDPYESEEAVKAFEKALRDAGRPVAIHRYAGTGHWFAEPSREAYRPKAANLAFERTVAFLKEQLR